MFSLADMSDIRTPPSLKWLLDKRSRLLGEIERLQEEHASLRQNLADEIQEAERRVAELKQKQVSTLSIRMKTDSGSHWDTATKTHLKTGTGRNAAA